MGDLPFELIEKIADYADIDSRRYMGFLPRRLVKGDYAWLDRFLEEKLACQYSSEAMGYLSTFLLSTGRETMYWLNYNYEYDEWMMVRTESVERCQYIEDCLFWLPSEDHYGKTLFVRGAFGESPVVDYSIRSRGLFAYVTDRNVRKLFGAEKVRLEILV